MSDVTPALLVDLARQLPGGQPSVIPGLTVDTDWREVARIPATSDDGHDAVVSVLRMPAMFWRVTGGGVDLSTGSGGEDSAGLVLTIARAIADDMIGPQPD